MIATLLRLAGIDVNVKYEICSWQSGQKNTAWIGPGGVSIYIYIYPYAQKYMCVYINIYTPTHDYRYFLWVGLLLRGCTTDHILIIRVGVSPEAGTCNIWTFLGSPFLSVRHFFSIKILKLVLPLNPGCARTPL